MGFNPEEVKKIKGYEELNINSSESEVEVNKDGGMQSKIYSKPTELPPIAVKEVAKVMGEGSERYPREEDGSPNWYKIGWLSNLDHALEHVFNALQLRNMTRIERGTMEEELSHAAARMLMCLEQFERGVE